MKMLDKRTYELLQGSTLLDQKLFNRKKNFFYNTSYDILIKGDCGSSSSYLEIFKEIRQKSNLGPIEGAPSEISTKESRNKTKGSTNYFTHNINSSNDSSQKFSSTLFANKSMAEISKCLLSSRISKSKKKTENCFSKSFLKSKSVSYMGNTMNSHRSFIKSLNERITHLDNEIEKMNKEIIFKVPSDLSNDQRTKVLLLLRDYFPKRPFQIMKDRYNKLFGNDHYFNKLKTLKSRISLRRLNRPTHISDKEEKGDMVNDLDNNKDDDKESYLKVVNGVSLYNRRVVSNKYDTFGKVKILNIPKDFYNDITGLNEKYSIGESNVREMYSMIDQKEQKDIDFANHYYYSREKRSNFNKTLNEINNKFSKVEDNGKKIKNSILKLKCFLNDRSPLISEKVFAFIDDSPKQSNKRNRHTPKEEIK